MNFKDKQEVKSRIYLLGIESFCPREGQKKEVSQAWWCTPVIPALGRLRQGDQCEFRISLGYESEFKASLSCIARPSQKDQKKVCQV